VCAPVPQLCPVCVLNALTVGLLCPCECRYAQYVDTYEPASKELDKLLSKVGGNSGCQPFCLAHC